jgi:hypothetical protein
MEETTPEINGKYLGTITQDFIKVADTLREAAYQIKVNHISDFPIFPISKTQLPIGQLLIGQADLGLSWNYYASFLNEFVERGLIDDDKIEFFTQNYKDIDEFCCLFVVDVEFTNFVFIPYPED